MGGSRSLSHGAGPNPYSLAAEGCAWSVQCPLGRAPNVWELVVGDTVLVDELSIGGNVYSGAFNVNPGPQTGNSTTADGRKPIYAV